jgi:hypothetical protein
MGIRIRNVTVYRATLLSEKFLNSWIIVRLTKSRFERFNFNILGIRRRKLLHWHISGSV